MAWPRHLGNPLVLAALVGALSSIGVAFVGGIFGAVSGYFDARDKAKLTILNSALGNAAPEQRIQAFIAAGLLDDTNCAIRKAAFHYTSDCKPPQ
jgi:hypothetical protein